MPDPYSDAAGIRLSRALATRTGTVAPPEAWRAFAAQAANETANGDPNSRGVRNNNPFNLRPISASQGGPWPGQVGVDNAPGGPFSVFQSTSAGIDAAATNYMSPSYANVVSTFQFGDPYALAKSIEASPWAAGGYGGALSQSIAGFSAGSFQSPDAIARNTQPTSPSPSLTAPPSTSVPPAMSAAGPAVPSIASRLSGFGNVPIVGGVLTIGIKAVITVGLIGLVFFGIVKIAGVDPGAVAKKTVPAAKAV
jgi:hypothetical protein